MPNAHSSIALSLYRCLSIVLPSRWSAKTVSPTNGPKVDMEFRKPMPLRFKHSNIIMLLALFYRNDIMYRPHCAIISLVSAMKYIARSLITLACHANENPFHRLSFTSIHNPSQLDTIRNCCAAKTISRDSEHAARCIVSLTQFHPNG